MIAPSRSRAHLLCLAGLTLYSSPALAQAPVQDADGGQSAQALEEIFVTARKREESLMTVPVAVSAISASELQRAGVADLTRIAQLAPQVMVSRVDGGTGAVFSIRGVGTPFSDPGLERSVSVNIDGVQVARGSIILQGFFDLQQVEILKGPQALFFGKNVTGGVISLSSVNPTDKLEGYVRGGYELEARERYVEAAIGGPLTDTLKARLAVRGMKMRGWLNNTARSIPNNPFFPAGTGSVAAGKHNSSKELTGRLTLLYKPSEIFDAQLKVSGGTYKDNGSGAQRICEPPLQVPTTNGIVDPFGECKLDGRYQRAGLHPALVANTPIARDGLPFTDTKSLLASLQMNLNLSSINISSTTGYAWVDNLAFLSFTYSSFSPSDTALGEKFKQLSQEIRVNSDYDGPVNFTIGAYFEDARKTNGTTTFFPIQVPDPANGRYEAFSGEIVTDGSTKSAFGQVRWDIVDSLELAGGVRYTRDHKSSNLANSYISPISGTSLNLLPVGQELNLKFRDSNWSPEATLSWKPDTDKLLYFAYKTGYLAGGFSAPGLIRLAPPNALTFKSARVRGIEAGFKAMLLDRSLRLEATAYSYLHKGLQLSSYDQATLSSSVRNAASSRIKGVELAAQWRITQSLSVNLSGTYNSARYISFPTAPCYAGLVCPSGSQDLSGGALPQAPKWTLAGGLTYDTPVTSTLSLGLNADASWKSGYLTSADASPLKAQEGYALFNAGARIYADEWEVALIGRNLTNKYYKVVGFTPSNGNSALVHASAAPRAREVRLQGTYRF